MRPRTTNGEGDIPINEEDVIGDTFVNIILRTVCTHQHVYWLLVHEYDARASCIILQIEFSPLNVKEKGSERETFFRRAFVQSRNEKFSSETTWWGSIKVLPDLGKAI